MGSIRTLLAVAVLITHADPLLGVELLNGDAAINCFFVISGFLMALILSEKYDDPRRFYLNRFLRIYPPYYAALLFSLAVFGVLATSRHDPLEYLGQLWAHQTGGLVLAALSNLTLIGVDLVRYVSIDNGQLQFPSFLYENGSGGHNFLFVPQAWTLALELEFYLLAPFVLRLRTIQIAALALAAYCVRVLVKDWANAAELAFDTAAAFPLVFGYFLYGVLAYRLYRHYRAWRLPFWLRRNVQFASVAAALVMIFFGRGGYGHLLAERYDALFLLFALLLPGLFEFSAGRRWDAWLGEFSYPVYLFHFALAQALYLTNLPDSWIGEATLLSTFALSAAYIYVVDRPIQRLRARIAAGPRAKPEPRIVEMPAR